MPDILATKAILGVFGKRATPFGTFLPAQAPSWR
jgi:hypothetical protein